MASNGNKIYSAIGKMIVSYSILDFNLRILIAELSSHDVRSSYMLATTLHNYEIRSILSSLGHEKFANEESARELDSLLGEAEKLQNKRNDIVHSLWLVGDSVAKRSKLVARFKKGLKTEDEYLEVATNKKLADDIERVSERLWPFIMDNMFKKTK